jgi:hypothetical protein
MRSLVLFLVRGAFANAPLGSANYRIINPKVCMFNIHIRLHLIPFVVVVLPHAAMGIGVSLYCKSDWVLQHDEIHCLWYI